MYFADIHCHILSGVDDGAKTDELMYGMLDTAYATGIRLLCATPHYNPEMFRHVEENKKSAFEKLKAYAENKYPDLKILRGNEIFVYSTVPSLVSEKHLGMYEGTRAVLIEFYPDHSFYEISKTVSTLSNLGFIPVLAHIERYPSVNKKNIAELKENGGVITVNAETIMGENGKKAQKAVHKYLKMGIVDIVASDAHKKETYNYLTLAYNKVLKDFDEYTVQHLFYKNARRLLGV